MSIQPQYHDADFGYIVEINVGQQMPQGPEIRIETVRGETYKLEFDTPAYKRALKFLSSMNELRSAQ